MPEHLPRLAPDAVTDSLRVVAALEYGQEPDQEQKQLMAPELANWPVDQLRSMLAWTRDRMKLLPNSADLDFEPFHIGETTDANKFKVLYKRVDARTVYCVACNEAEALVFSLDSTNPTSGRDWKLIGTLKVPGISKALSNNGFVNYTDIASAPEAEVPDNDNDDDDSELSDYWRQYGERSEAENDESHSKEDGIRVTAENRLVFIRSYILNFTSDLWSLYEAFGASSQDLANDILSVGTIFGGSSVPSKKNPKLYDYTVRAVTNLERLLHQLSTDLESIKLTIKLALLQLDPQILDNAAVA